MSDAPDELLASYDFALPEELIAQHPAPRRDASRLMVVDRAGEGEELARFADLPRILSERLPEGALLVANNSRVAPARLFGARASGGRVEMLLLTPPPLLEPEPDAVPGFSRARAEVLLRASKTLRRDEELDFGPDLVVRVGARGEFGRHEVELSWRGELAAVLAKQGCMPLPPYIRREAAGDDMERYQTVYASADKAGSVAAPTAGLHFTPEVRADLAARGIEWAEVTLYVGYGTFSPVRAADIRDHRMHAEWVEVPEATAAAVARAKAEGRPVLAVGTTSVRSLEGAFAQTGEPAPFCGTTSIFIRPGFRFRVVDHMLTNFHLPLSSLIIMVSAFAGRVRILSAYDRAVRERFRFFSYGDAMLIL
ncbi:tRNA preQ1(34) S-adenosylmethionine ribosyltransferase-isomerase QueA [Desulfovibrio sp. X2]|uniref:tRNA preQ1(34) S-adenosylmethionine ribosyltransferase-isomerase QueA n=1 Tax=Desulfovibrio sp. X2 TaxID=941449 RepID=UPI0005522878|nr:tRNA preQ1(34) S-adenosylmethionine ribosyltransferase-isomerase QueA [Desulfovibrio sp. X2]